MLPATALCNDADRAATHAEGFRNRAVRDFTAELLFDNRDLRLGQLSVAVCRPAGPSLRVLAPDVAVAVRGAPLGSAVSHIVGRSAEEQMPNPLAEMVTDCVGTRLVIADAGGIIAGVANHVAPGWRSAGSEFPRDSVRASVVDLAIAVRVLAARPFPTVARTVSVAGQAIRQCLTTVRTCAWMATTLGVRSRWSYRKDGVAVGTGARLAPLAPYACAGARTVLANAARLVTVRGDDRALALLTQGMRDILNSHRSPHFGAAPTDVAASRGHSCAGIIA